MPDARSDPSSLVVVALANAFGLASAVYISASVSGGHVNPAVTFGKVVGCRIPIPTAIFYWISQILGSVIACLVLKLFTVNQVIKLTFFFNFVPSLFDRNNLMKNITYLHIIAYSLIYLFLVLQQE